MKPLTPEAFWQLYANELNEQGTLDTYKSDACWTKKVTCIAKNVIDTMLDVSCDEADSKNKSYKEYFRIDVIGCTTKWQKSNPLHNWKLKIAYEHENGITSPPSSIVKT